jgi:hypothetical protein
MKGDIYHSYPAAEKNFSEGRQGKFCVLISKMYYSSEKYNQLIRILVLLLFSFTSTSR